MSRILVHLHIYYHSQVDYFIEKMKNIQGVEWDLVVSFSQKDTDTLDKILKFKPDVKFFEVENLGYDILPFIEVIKSSDLSAYDYVVKLHTKRDVKKCAVNVIPLRGYEWRNALVDGVLYSPGHFCKVIDILEKNKEIGMISNLLTYSKRNWDSYSPWIEKEMHKLGLECKGDHFCMGTMFIARASVLRPLQSPLITKETFRDTIDDKERDFKSAHYYERLISVLPYSFGLTHIPVSPRKSDALLIKLARFPEKPFRWMFCIEKKGPQKRKFIRIFGMEFYLQKEVRHEKG